MSPCPNTSLHCSLVGNGFTAQNVFAIENEMAMDRSQSQEVFSTAKNILRGVRLDKGAIRKPVGLVEPEISALARAPTAVRNVQA